MGFLDSVGSALLGGLGSSSNPNDYRVNNPQQAGIDRLMGRNAAQLDPAAQAQFRAMQMAQAQALQRIASGQQQGAGELAAQRQVQQALAAQQAQARMARGGQNAALAFRGAADNAAGIGLAGAGQAQQAALQDQQTAQAQLANSLSLGRGQDLSLAGQNAQLRQNQYGTNLGALTTLNGQQLGAQQQAMQSAMSQQGILGGLMNAGGQILGAYVGGKGGGGGTGGGTGGGGGYSPFDGYYNAAPAVPAGGGGASSYGLPSYNGEVYSDRDLKADIDEDAGKDVDAMLDRLQAKGYRYADPKHGKGRRVGVMAQDLLKSKAGAAVVKDADDGKALDVNAAISAALAASARLHERVRKLERTS